MENVNWGVPAQRKSKVEKFNTPVLTMSDLKGKGTGRKFSFNKAAQTALGIDSEKTQTVMVGFDKTGVNNSIFIKVVEGENELGYRLTKSATFSNKKIFEFITDRKSLDNNVENELHLEQIEDNDIFEVTSVTNTNDVLEEENAEEQTSEAVVDEVNSEESTEEEEEIKAEDVDVSEEDAPTKEAGGFEDEW